MALAPPIFIEIDPLQDLADAVAYYESLTGTPLPPAAVERMVLSAIAYRHSLMKSQTQDACLQNLVDFARAPSLDYLGIYVGVTRLAAAAAITTIEFTVNVNVSGLTIPQGTRIASIDGLAVFVLIADLSLAATILTGSGIAECDATGEQANGYIAGQISQIQDIFPYLISAANTDTSAGGSDAETDDALRVRIKAAPAAFSVAGSRKAYQYHALTASSLLVDVAVPDTDGDGIVRLYPLMRDGSATPSLILTAVEDACSGETVRPLSDTVTAIAPTAVNYTLTVPLTIYTTAPDSDADIQAAVEAALTEYTTAMRQTMGRDIRSSQLFQVIHNAAPGQIFTAGLTGFSNVVVGETEYAFLTALTVTVLGRTDG